MNYFGLFFSFMLPGVIIGLIAAACIMERFKAGQARRKRLKPEVNNPGKARLFIYSLADDTSQPAA